MPNTKKQPSQWHCTNSTPGKNVKPTISGNELWLQCFVIEEELFWSNFCFNVRPTIPDDIINTNKRAFNRNGETVNAIVKNVCYLRQPLSRCMCCATRFGVNIPLSSTQLICFVILSKVIQIYIETYTNTHFKYTVTHILYIKHTDEPRVARL